MPWAGCAFGNVTLLHPWGQGDNEFAQRAYCALQGCRLPLYQKLKCRPCMYFLLTLTSLEWFPVNICIFIQKMIGTWHWCRYYTLYIWYMLARQKNKGFSIICREHRAERIEEKKLFLFYDIQRCGLSLVHIQKHYIETDWEIINSWCWRLN